MIYNCSYFNPVNIGSSTEQFIFASSSCELQNSSSSAPAVYNGFSYGEIVGNFFLFLVFIGVFSLLFVKLFFLKRH